MHQVSQILQFLKQSLFIFRRNTLFNKTLKASLLGIIICLVAGCSTKEPEVLTEEEYYKRAKTALENQTFLEASRHLRDLETYHPFGRYAEQAQLDLLFARYRSLDTVGASAVADRFTRLHPDSPHVDYARYIKGLAAYYADETISVRFFPINADTRDPGRAREAFQEFSILINQFPDSPYAPDAQKRMIAIKERLARYELNVAEYYIQRQAFVAALGRTNYLIENFPDTNAVADALALNIELYRLLGMNEHASDSLVILAANFPEHDSFDSNMRFVGNKVELQRRDLLSIFDLGLFGD